MFKSDTDKKVTPTTAAVQETATIGHEVGNGGELHQVAGGTHPAMRTQGGVIIHDDENQLKVGDRGPSLAEDHFYLERPSTSIMSAFQSASSTHAATVRAATSN